MASIASSDTNFLSPPEDPRAVVADGYDQLGIRYLQWTAGNDPRFRLQYLARLMERLERGSTVLELGCGSGVPVAEMLADGHFVTGVDFSERQVLLARRHVPRADFIVTDMTEIDFPPGSFDAVAAFYSLIHLPREEQPGMIAKIARWLRPGGLYVANMGTADNPGFLEDWIDGVPMFWSSFDAETNLGMIRQAGLSLLRSEVLGGFEDGRPVSFLWVLAEREPLA